MPFIIRHILYTLSPALLLLLPSVLLAGEPNEPLGWRLGPTAWSFRSFTFFEAVAKTSALGMHYIEAFEGQRISKEVDRKLGPDLPDDILARIREELTSAEVKLISIYVHRLPAEEAACRKVFEFCRKLGVEMVVSEPAPGAIGTVEKLCDEYDIKVAIHNHPKGSSLYWHPQEVLKACKGRSPRLGACADIGHWQRCGVNPVEGVGLLGSRLLGLHVKDLNELGAKGHDVPWGTGKGEIAAVLREVHRLGLKPALFGIEYEYKWENNTGEIARCAEFFRKTVRGIAAEALSAAALQGPVKIFRAGAHSVDISPEKFPVIVNASFTERSADRVVDRLFARAIVLDDGQTRVVLCVVDTTAMDRDLIDRAKELAAKATGIPTQRMCVSATHTHSAPAAVAALGSRADARYVEWLPGRIADAIAGAVKNLAPARVGWAVVDDWEHTFNRRWIRRPDKMITDPFGQRNGRAHMHPGYQNSGAIGPSGPVDPGLSLLAVQSTNGRAIALLANYSQHYFGSPLLSSDYCGRFTQHMARLLDANGSSPPFVGIMSQGTSGDLMWMDYGSPPRKIDCDKYASDLAERAMEAYRRIEWHDWAPLRMAERTLTLARRAPDEKRLAWARQVAESLAGRLPRALPEIYAWEAVYLHEQPEAKLKLQAIRIGDLGIAALPSEAFAITGLKLKRQSPLQPTFNIELANGAEGYIPPPEQHCLGGYTTWPARSAGLEVQAEPRIVETVLGLLEEVSGRPRRALSDEHGPYAKAVLDAKPMAYWRLNDMVTPNARDAAASGRDATYENGVALYLPGVGSGTGLLPNPRLTRSSFSGSQINRAAHFAGGRLRAKVPLTGEAYSVELWLWNGLPHDARVVTGYVFSRGADGDKTAAGEHLGIGGTDSSDLAGRLFVTNGKDRVDALVGRTSLRLRHWHHVVFAREGRRMTVFLDGKADITGEFDITAKPGEQSVFIAGRCDNFANFEGKVDEVAIYGRSLSPAEVAAHFKAGQKGEQLD